MDWNAMQGNETSRYCDHCQKQVYNLSALPADEAERLVCNSAGSLCVRFARDPVTNAVLTLEYAPQKQYSRRRAFATIAALATAFGSVAAWAGIKLTTKPAPAPPMMVLGGISAPPSPAPPCPIPPGAP
jgi:hypothetical protein